MENLSNRTLFVNAMKQSKSVKYIKANTLMSEMEQARIKSTKLHTDQAGSSCNQMILAFMDLDLDKCRIFLKSLDTRDGRKSTVVISQRFQSVHGFLAPSC